MEKIALYIQFLKDKESALYFVEVSILYKLYVDPIMFSAENWKELAISGRWIVEGIFFYSRSAEEKQSEHNIEYKDSILVLLISWPLKFGMKFGVPGVFHIDIELL